MLDQSRQYLNILIESVLPQTVPELDIVVKIGDKGVDGI